MEFIREKNDIRLLGIKVENFVDGQQENLTIDEASA